MFESQDDSPLLPPKDSPKHALSMPPLLLAQISQANPITNKAPDHTAPTLQLCSTQPHLTPSLLDVRRAKQPVLPPQPLQEFEQFRLNPLVYHRGRPSIQSHIKFQSRFEGGNLQKVCEVNGELLCLISRDNSRDAYGHWYYFQVAGLKGVVKFRIIAFRKRKSLYEQGMHPCVRVRNIWGRGGSKISYSFFRQVTGVNYYSLAFEYDFGKSTQPVAFAYSFPYTYRDLNLFISQLTSNPVLSQHLKVRQLCKSLLGNPVPMISVSGNKPGKPIIFVTGRAHPGETVGSFAVQGLLRMALGDSLQAQLLRQSFQLLVVPMMNVDGVVRGNYRFSAAGCDLNRKWTSPEAALFPQVFHAKQLVLSLAGSRDIAYILDFHGHSRKDSYFFYGCMAHPNQLGPRLLAFTLSTSASKHFALDYCHYRMTKDKAGTLRISLYQSLNALSLNPIIYTVESSFFGNSLREWLRLDYIQIGAQVLRGIVQVQGNRLDIQQALRLKDQATDPAQLQKNWLQQQSGSDSSPDDGQCPAELVKDLLAQQTKETVLRSAKIITKKSQPDQLQAHRQRSSKQSILARVKAGVSSASNQQRRSVMTRGDEVGRGRRELIRSRVATRQSQRTRGGREEYSIPTVYFGEHGGRGELKCLLVSKVETKQMVLQGEEAGEKRCLQQFPKGYNVRRIKFQHVSRRRR